MHQLIASYLFQNRSCPLPGLGNLSMKADPAQTDFSNNRILSPTSTIHFEPGETNTGLLINWLANKSNNSKLVTLTALDVFCNDLKKDALNKDLGANLEGVGTFVVNSDGGIDFVGMELPHIFHQPVQADRIIRLVAEHNLLVGDKHTTNIEMTEFLNEDSLKKEHWWIWALVLGLVAISLIFLYAADTNSSPEFGNAIKILSLP